MALFRNCLYYTCYFQCTLSRANILLPYMEVYLGAPMCQLRWVLLNRVYTAAANVVMSSIMATTNFQMLWLIIRKRGRQPTAMFHLPHPSPSHWRYVSILSGAYVSILLRNMTTCMCLNSYRVMAQWPVYKLSLKSVRSTGGQPQTLQAFTNNWQRTNIERYSGIKYSKQFIKHVCILMHSRSYTDVHMIMNHILIVI